MVVLAPVMVGGSCVDGDGGGGGSFLPKTICGHQETWNARARTHRAGESKESIWKLVDRTITSTES